MKLGDLQECFSIIKAKLFLYADELGYGVREKAGPVCQNCLEHNPKSNHKLGLATDIRLTINGVLLESIPGRNWEADYNLLHDYWDKMGGAPRIAKDLGHFSVKYQGRW